MAGLKPFDLDKLSAKYHTSRNESVYSRMSRESSRTDWMSNATSLYDAVKSCQPDKIRSLIQDPEVVQYLVSLGYGLDEFRPYHHEGQRVDGIGLNRQLTTVQEIMSDFDKSAETL